MENGKLFPFTLVLGSPELNEIFKVSVIEVSLLKQSRISTVNVTVEPTTAVIVGSETGYTSENHEFGTPAAVVQLEFPELLLVNVTLGL
jgi:hypothetical protein